MRIYEDIGFWLELVYLCVMTGKQEVSVESPMQRMRTLSQKHDECSETELNNRFKIVEQQVSEATVDFWKFSIAISFYLR